MKKIKSVLVLALILALVSTLKVHAADYATDEQAKAEVTLTASSETAKIGDTVTLTLAVKCPTGVEAIHAILEYDETKLELINETAIANKGYNSLSGIDGLTGKFDLFLMCVTSADEGTPKEATVGSLQFKVLEAAEVNEELPISLLEVKVGDSEDAWFEIADKSATIEVIESKPTEPEPTEPEPTEPEPTEPKPTEPEPEKPTQPEKPKEDGTIADKDFNKAGIKAYGIISIIAIALIATVFYKKSKKYNGIK